MGAIRADSVGLFWADVDVSSQNLARGSFNDNLENPLAIFAAELIERVEVAERALAKHRAEAARKDASLLSEVEAAKRALQNGHDGIEAYANGAPLPPSLRPQCDKAIEKVVGCSRREALKAARLEIEAAKQRMKDSGWQFTAARLAGSSIVIAHKMQVSELAAKPHLITEVDCRRNIRRATDQLCQPGVDRRDLASVAQALIEEALKVGASQSARRPSRWYPSGPVASAESAMEMAKIALSPHVPLRPVSFGAINIENDNCGVLPVLMLPAPSALLLLPAPTGPPC
jgi:hypothetical protein